MCRTRYFVNAFVLIAFLSLLQGCCSKPQKITAVHTYGQIYAISIGDSSGGGGITGHVMILMKPDCTDSHWLPDVIEFSMGDTTGGGGKFLKTRSSMGDTTGGGGRE